MSITKTPIKNREESKSWKITENSKKKDIETMGVPSAPPPIVFLVYFSLTVFLL